MIKLKDILTEEKAAKDYDGDGTIESPEDEYMGSKDKAIKHAMKSEGEADTEIKIGDYQTKHYHMCPGAKTLYQDIEGKVEDMDLAVRTAKLQDALFALEMRALRELVLEVMYEGVHDPVKPGILKKRLGKLSCSKVRQERSKLKDKGTHYAKALQRYLNYHCQ
jgi:hypothetical protein